MGKLTHFNEAGGSRMVNVSGKAVTVREARASCLVRMREETLVLIRDRGVAKGDVFEVARLAGIMATKRTWELIPLCHSLVIDGVEVELTTPDRWTVRVEATVWTEGKTGVEMEALTAATVAGLTIYDMCKAVDREMVIERVQLEEKRGGRSGHFQRRGETDAAVGSMGPETGVGS